MAFIAIAAAARGQAAEAPPSAVSRPGVDPALVGSWEGRCRDYGLFDPVRFEIKPTGQFDVWIRDEHRPYTLEASNCHWTVRAPERNFTQSGTYDLKEDGRVTWWGMFTTAPIMERVK